MVQILDSFEDGDISEYSGGTNNFSISQDEPFEGSYSLESSVSGGDYIYRLDKTIEIGQTPFGAWLNSLSATNYSKNAGFVWAVETNDNGINGYVACYDKVGNMFQLFELTDGAASLLAETSINSTSPYMEARITTWDSNGNISASLFDENGTEQATLSVTDTRYSSGGFGWIIDPNVSRFGGYKQAYFDFAFKPEGLAPPTNVEIVDSSTEDELKVDWSTSGTNANGYYVYRAESSGSSKSDYTQVADVSSPPYTDIGLEDGEQYYYRVSSHD